MEDLAVKSNGKSKNGNVKNNPSRKKLFEEKSDSASWSVNMYLAYAIGILLRFVLISSDEDESLTNRVELATPLNSFGRLTEGVTLWRDQKTDPYSGVIFHETPLTLHLFAIIPPERVPSVFILIDVITALLIGLLAHEMIKF